MLKYKALYGVFSCMVALLVREKRYTDNSVGDPKVALNTTQRSSSLSFGLFQIRGRHSRYLHFYNVAFVLWSDALPATNPLFGGKNTIQRYCTKILIIKKDFFVIGR